LRPKRIGGFWWNWPGAMEMTAMEIVMAIERNLRYIYQDAREKNLGYDLESAIENRE
jgi:hypothetical protein